VKTVSLLFFVYEKKAIKSVLHVTAILFKNGVFRMEANDIGVVIVVFALSRRIIQSRFKIALFGLKNGCWNGRFTSTL
jgi:uncharacterized membrane protein (DUF2068 family)